jgi:hypothetical protein
MFDRFNSVDARERERERLSEQQNERIRTEVSTRRDMLEFTWLKMSSKMSGEVECPSAILRPIPLQLYILLALSNPWAVS